MERTVGHAFQMFQLAPAGSAEDAFHPRDWPIKRRDARRFWTPMNTTTTRTPVCHCLSHSCPRRLSGIPRRNDCIAASLGSDFSPHTCAVALFRNSGHGAGERGAASLAGAEERASVQVGREGTVRTPTGRKGRGILLTVVGQQNRRGSPRHRRARRAWHAARRRRLHVARTRRCPRGRRTWISRRVSQASLRVFGLANMSQLRGPGRPL